MPHPPRVASFARLAFWPSLLSILMLTLSPLGNGAEPSSVLGHDKLQHLLAFAGLACLARLAWGMGHACGVVLGLSMVAGVIELFQAIPMVHRTPSAWDWVAGSIGAFCGLGVGCIWALMTERAQ
jgi:hypothetical protein